MKLSLLKNKRGLIYSPEIDEMIERENWVIEAVDAAFIDFDGFERVVRVDYPMPQSVQLPNDNDKFYLSEVWLTVNEKRQVEEIFVSYDRTTRTPMISERIDH